MNEITAAHRVLELMAEVSALRKEQRRNSSGRLYTTDLERLMKLFEDIGLKYVVNNNPFEDHICMYSLDDCNDYPYHEVWLYFDKKGKLWNLQHEVVMEEQAAEIAKLSQTRSISCGY